MCGAWARCVLQALGGRVREPSPALPPPCDPPAPTTTPTPIRHHRHRQMGIILVGVELHRKNQEDGAKKAKEAAEKEAIRDLHERHLAAERVRAVLP